MEQIDEFLQSLDLFKNIEKSSLETLVKMSSLKKYKKGKILFSTGDIYDEVFLLKKGRVQIFLKTFNKKREFLQRLEKGSLIGEMEIFDDRPIIANCVAETNIEVITFDKNKFKSFISSHPKILEKVFSETLNKWRNMEQSLHNLLDELKIASKKIRTDEKVLQEQKLKIEEESRLKEIFIENISHELRTPLTIIQGILESINIDDNNPIILDIDLYKKLQSSSNYLLDLINELLDFSQLSKGITSLQNEWINISTELNTIIENFSFLANTSHNKDINFKYSVPDPLFVYIDIKRIRQILYHLLSNALKFTDKGSIETTIACTDFCDKSCNFNIVIKDTGIGISPEDQKVIFNKFVRVKNKYYSLRGTGLGLSLVKTLVDLMKGLITVESELNVGTEIQIKIPIEYRPFIRDSHEIKDDLILKSLDQPVNVLLIDDYQDTHIIVKALLKNYPQVSLDSLFDWTHVMETIDKKNYDFILLDIMLPEMDGFKIIEMINKHYKKLKTKTKPKIIAFTALSSEHELKRIEEAQFDSKLLKPFTKGDLIKILLS